MRIDPAFGEDLGEHFELLIVSVLRQVARQYDVVGAGDARVIERTKRLLPSRSRVGGPTEGQIGKTKACHPSAALVVVLEEVEV